MIIKKLTKQNPSIKKKNFTKKHSNQTQIIKIYDSNIKNLDDHNIKIIKQIGVGMQSKVYLVEINSLLYAMKIQNILENDKKKSYSKRLWREIDFYEYINTLSEDDQEFFNKLYAYKIHNNCKFKSNFINSKWCLNFILRYESEYTLKTYLLQNSNISTNIIYSFILQLIKILMIFHKGGYAHNDFHFRNILVKNTNKTHFKFQNYNIPYYGKQLVIIDYGLVLHKKFKSENETNMFFLDTEYYLFKEMYKRILDIIINMPNLRNKHGINNYDKFFEITFKQIMIHHEKFFKTASLKYIKIFGNSSIINYIYDNRESNETLDNLIKNSDINYDFKIWKVINRIVYEFLIMYPKEFKKYFGLSSNYKINFPKKEYLEFLLTKNYKEIINLFLKKYKK